MAVFTIHEDFDWKVKKDEGVDIKHMNVGDRTDDDSWELLYKGKKFVLWLELQDTTYSGDSVGGLFRIERLPDLKWVCSSRKKDKILAKLRELTKDNTIKINTKKFEGTALPTVTKIKMKYCERCGDPHDTEDCPFRLKERAEVEEDRFDWLSKLNDRLLLKYPDKYFSVREVQNFKRVIGKISNKVKYEITNEMEDDPVFLIFKRYLSFGGLARKYNKVYDAIYRYITFYAEQNNIKSRKTNDVLPDNEKTLLNKYLGYCQYENKLTGDITIEKNDEVICSSKDAEEAADQFEELREQKRHERKINSKVNATLEGRVVEEEEEDDEDEWKQEYNRKQKMKPKHPDFGKSFDLERTGNFNDTWILTDAFGRVWTVPSKDEGDAMDYFSRKKGLAVTEIKRYIPKKKKKSAQRG